MTYRAPIEREETHIKDTGRYRFRTTVRVREWNPNETPLRFAVDTFWPDETVESSSLATLDELKDWVANIHLDTPQMQQWQFRTAVRLAEQITKQRAPSR
jgi:Lon protease-like protein